MAVAQRREASTASWCSTPNLASPLKESTRRKKRNDMEHGGRRAQSTEAADAAAEDAAVSQSEREMTPRCKHPALVKERTVCDRCAVATSPPCPQVPTHPRNYSSQSIWHRKGCFCAVTWRLSSETRTAAFVWHRRPCNNPPAPNNRLT
jgi:hypothetical protein